MWRLRETAIAEQADRRNGHLPGEVEELGAYAPALMRQWDGLIAALARERTRGRRLYRWREGRRDGLLAADELDPSLAKEAVLVGYLACGTLWRSCTVAGVPRAVVEEWKAADPEFSRLLVLASDELADRYEERLMRRVMREGAEADQGSTVLSIFLMKRLRPHAFRDDLPAPSPAAQVETVALTNLENPYLQLASRLAAERERLQLPPGNSESPQGATDGEP